VTSWRPTDRTTVVRIACLLTIALVVVAHAVTQAELASIEVRFRVLLLSQASTPSTGMLLVLAATAAVLTDRGRRLVQGAGVALAALTLAGTYAYATLTMGPGGVGWRLGVAMYTSANGILAGFAVWLAAQPSVSAGGSPPDGGTA
jgi:hypothetical protein